MSYTLGVSRAVAKKKKPRSSNPRERVGNPAVSTTALLIGGAVVAVGVTVGVILWRRSQDAGAPGDEASAIRAQIKAIVDGKGGAVTASEATDELYASMYPDCPETLNPDDPEHVECMKDWLDIYAVALEIVGDPLRPSSGSGGGSDSPPPTEAERVLFLFSALSDMQKNDLRTIFGAALIAELQEAALANQRMQVRKILGDMRAALKAKDDLDEYVALLSINISLGPLADEFAWLLNQ